MGPPPQQHHSNLRSTTPTSAASKMGISRPCCCFGHGLDLPDQKETNITVHANMAVAYTAFNDETYQYH